MRFTIHLFGREIVEIVLAPTPPTADRPEQPVVEASGGGDFGFGPLHIVEDRPDIT